MRSLFTSFLAPLALCSACTYSQLPTSGGVRIVDPKAFTSQVVSKLEKKAFEKGGVHWGNPTPTRRVPRVTQSLPSIFATRPILNLLGATEGTDRGDGYNETLSYGAYTNGDVKLTSMTLAEIDALQTKMLRHSDNHLNSSAVGRYQIVRKTMRELKRDLNLDDNMLFTSELQDRLAVELLNKRGLESWRQGEMNDASFALNLAREWASLPKPNSCKGYYQGQKAAICFSELVSVFGRMRVFHH